MTAVTADGKRWREATPYELSELPAEALVYFGQGAPKPAGDYASMCFPGRFPYLPGCAMLGIPVYIEDPDSP